MQQQWPMTNGFDETVVHNTRRGRLYIILALLCAALLLAARLWTMHTAASRPFGRYSAAQILGRAEPLCRTFTPHNARLWLQPAHLLTIQSKDNRLPQPLWQVECVDESGEEVACLVCDGNTGELLALTHRLPVLEPHGRTILSAAQARREAGEWLSVLGLNQGGQWQPADAPVHIRHGWHVGWQRRDSAGRLESLTIRVDAHSGDLITVRRGAVPRLEDMALGE